MKILFLGDSLTQGTLGVSYITLLRKQLHNNELINAGKNGDTVISLHHRLIKSQINDHMDLIFLWVGTNDILAKISWDFPFWRIILKQPWAQNHTIFKDHYKKILQMTSTKTTHVFTISPLFIGEDMNNRWNKELQELSTIITQLSTEYPNVEYIDLRQIFTEQLATKHISSYLPKNIITGFADAVTLRSNTRVDAKARERGFHYTFDGVHLNSAGALIVAETFKKLIKNKEKKHEQKNYEQNNPLHR